ncbi:HTH-type transcriptional regulator SgrR [bioreactor metagenome]|uniref:HTH-type transcriptional regulator SgrR n=1 Tax=bioreactor metagenome TaxID=1076179 RepID=A0A644T610_9ZZZZ|nr:ABC transporter substrate-binding protein [Candidatus Elulimicrobiales bacterium]
MEDNTIKNESMYDINLDIEKNVKKIKQKNKKKTFWKKISIIKASYILTYKSLPARKIFLFWTSVILGLIFLFLAFTTFSNKFLIDVPTYGGEISEGVIGVPRYINPVLASTDSEKDLTRLVFSGLLKKDIEGNIINDLATEVSESDDRLSYTVFLNPDAKFHDGRKITSDDVIFTLNKIQDKKLNSSLAINFEGVTAEKIDDTTLTFHLKRPFFHFKESLTFGILPKHLLENLSTEEFTFSEFNIRPVGSGPFKIDSVVKKSNIANKYVLAANKNYLNGRPYLDKININIYQNTEDLLSALNDGKIESTSHLNYSSFAKINSSNKNIVSRNLTTVYSLSFNPNKNSLLAEKNIRVYLSSLINKQEIIDSVFGGYVTKKDFFFGNSDFASETTTDPESKDLEKLKEKTLTITTADLPELKQVTEKIADTWRAQGVNVEVVVYSLSNLAEVIKNRDFEILVFGSIIERDTDLYAYWHSTQKAYPGLNITGYMSNALDKNLESLRQDFTETRVTFLEEINQELIKEVPAMPLYSNNLNYTINNKDLAKELDGLLPKNLLDKSERFIEVKNWFKFKEKVWKFSYKKPLIEKLQNLLH